MTLDLEDVSSFYEAKSQKQHQIGILEEPIQEGYSTERQDLLAQNPAESNLDSVRDDTKLLKEKKLSSYRELSFTASGAQKQAEVDFSIVNLLNMDSSKSLPFPVSSDSSILRTSYKLRFELRKKKIIGSEDPSKSITSNLEQMKRSKIMKGKSEAG